MASSLPTEILHKIYLNAVGMRNEDTLAQVRTSIMNALDLLYATEPDEFSMPIFENSSDIIWANMIRDDSLENFGVHRISLEIEIGDELFCVYKDDFDAENEMDVKLWIGNKNSSKKYENIVVECFKFMFEDGLIY